MFVSFEGLDGSGKSTQAELLAGAARGRRSRRSSRRASPAAPSSASRSASSSCTAATSSPGRRRCSTPPRARSTSSRSSGRRSSAARSVLCDRYVDSSVAYQGVGRGLGLERVLELNLAAVEGLLPAAHLPPAARSRRGLDARSAESHDRLEREDEAFHRRVDAGYRELAERFPERIVMLDGARPPEQIAEEVHGALRVST